MAESGEPCSVQSVNGVESELPNEHKVDKIDIQDKNGDEKTQNGAADTDQSNDSKALTVAKSNDKLEKVEKIKEVSTIETAKDANSNANSCGADEESGNKDQQNGGITEIPIKENKRESKGKPKTVTIEPVALYEMPKEYQFQAEKGQSKKLDEHFNVMIKTNDKKHLKQFLRTHHWSDGHPAPQRIWLETCRFIFRWKTSVYQDMLEDIFKGEALEVIPLPTFVDSSHVPQYYLTKKGVHHVHLILVVLENLNPDITFCPLLYPITALFLHFMEPEDCFNCLYGMVRSRESLYLAQTKVAVDATHLVMRDLAKHHAKSAYSSISKDTDGNVEPVFRNWIWWIFNDLPFPILVKVMDVYLYEGVKVFYRVALAILILYHKHTIKLRGDSSSFQGVNVSTRIKHFCANIPYSVEKILKTAFGIRGLGKKEVRKLHLRHEMYEKSTTVRMTRASSIARSTSRNSFSGHSGTAYTRSHSIPAPLMVKKSKTKGDTISQDLLMTVWGWLPARYTICQPHLLYTSEEHGISLRTLYSRINHHEPTLFVIKTTKNEIFGAFCSTDWRQRVQRGEQKNLSYFGTGETFIFTLSPLKKVYEWVGLSGGNISATASMFLAGDHRALIIGGGSGTAIHLDDGLVHCRTEKCDTFNNPPLCLTQDFSCKVLEVFGFR